MNSLDCVHVCLDGDLFGFNVVVIRPVVSAVDVIIDRNLGCGEIVDAFLTKNHKRRWRLEVDAGPRCGGQGGVCPPTQRCFSRKNKCSLTGQ